MKQKMKQRGSLLVLAQYRKKDLWSQRGQERLKAILFQRSSLSKVGTKNIIPVNQAVRYLLRLLFDKQYQTPKYQKGSMHLKNRQLQKERVSKKMKLLEDIYSIHIQHLYKPVAY